MMLKPRRSGLRLALRLAYKIENCLALFKETKSVTMNIFGKKSFLFKSFVKIELSHVFTINMFSTAKNCIEN